MAMTQKDLDRLDADLKSGQITAKEAIKLLIKEGRTAERAWEGVFLTLGGDDIVETNGEGVEYYRRSGKLVSDVMAKMNQ